MLDQAEFHRWGDAGADALAAAQFRPTPVSWLPQWTRCGQSLGWLRAVVVVGSVARGDFNCWSDVDVVVADAFRGSLLDRLDRLGARPGRVEPFAWTPEEWRAHLHRGNPMATEALERGVWLVGSPPALRSPGGADSG